MHYAPNGTCRESHIGVLDYFLIENPKKPLLRGVIA